MAHRVDNEFQLLITVFFQHTLVDWGEIQRIHNVQWERKNHISKISMSNIIFDIKITSHLQFEKDSNLIFARRDSQYIM